MSNQSCKRNPFLFHVQESLNSSSHNRFWNFTELVKWLTERYLFFRYTTSKYPVFQVFPTIKGCHLTDQIPHFSGRWKWVILDTADH